MRSNVRKRGLSCRAAAFLIDFEYTNLTLGPLVRHVGHMSELLAGRFALINLVPRRTQRVGGIIALVASMALCACLAIAGSTEPVGDFRLLDQNGVSRELYRY